jgi:ribosome-associated heat shock protein Hsp15
MTPADSGGEDRTGGPAAAQRLDRWLWFSRVVRSRTLAASLITAGKVRVNKIKAEKPSQSVKPGDVVTSSIKKSVRVLRVKATGERRGPASEAAALYEDLTPPAAKPVNGEAGTGVQHGAVGRLPGTGRPTKRDRRSIDRLQGRE